MKNRYRFVITFLIFILFINIYPQDFQGYVVKKIGNLVVIDIGSKKGLIENSSYIIKKTESLKIPLLNVKIATREFTLGQYSITQLEENFSVGKILRPTEKKFSVGDRISIYFYSYSDFVSEIKEHPETSAEKTEELKPTVKIPPAIVKEEKPEKQVKEVLMPWEKRNPVYLGGGYTFGLKNIPEAVLDGIREFLINEIYSDPPEIETSLKQSSGFGFNAGYYPVSFLSVGFSYSGLRNESSITTASVHADDVEPSGPFPEDPIKSWEFDVRTNVSILSLSASIGNFKSIIDNYKSNLSENSLVYYFGGGVNYCNLSINFDENYIMYGLNNKEEMIIRSEKFNPGKYTGWFVNAGAGYPLIGGLFFGEFSYHFWDNLKFDKSSQFIIGFKTFF